MRVKPLQINEMVHLPDAYLVCENWMIVNENLTHTILNSLKGPLV